jgi:hypothetical protein
MALNPLHLLLLQGAATRQARGSGAPAAPASTTAASAASTPTSKDPIVANQFEFLDKHFDPTDIPEVAAQTAYERFGNYPNARVSTVIFGIGWTVLTDSIKHAVLNYVNGGVYGNSAYATLDMDRSQWNIVLTGLQFVNATRVVVRGRAEYQIDEYNNGSVFVKAEALGGQLLGDIVHLETGFGTWVQEVKLKNSANF